MAAVQHTIIEELADEPDVTQFDAELSRLLTKAKEPERLLECVMAFLQKQTTLLTTPAGRDKANEVINNYIKRPGKPMQAGFFGKSAAVASPASRRDTPAEKEAQATTSDARAQELLDQVVKPPAIPAAPEEEAEAPHEPKGLKPTAGNGAAYEHYSFTQTLSELTVLVPVPPGTKGRDCDVRIERSTLRVGVKGQPPVIDGKLFAEVKPEECAWTISDNKLIELTLCKQSGMCWWGTVVDGDPEIDVQLVEPENSKLTDLDGETRATVEKMMWDQRQKQMGKATSDEMRKQQILQQFMAQHPEMDFSNAQISL